MYDWCQSICLTINGQQSKRSSKKDVVVLYHGIKRKYQKTIVILRKFFLKRVFSAVCNMLHGHMSHLSNVISVNCFTCQNVSFIKLSQMSKVVSVKCLRNYEIWLLNLHSIHKGSCKIPHYHAFYFCVSVKLTK